MAVRTYRFWGEFADDDITKLPSNYEARITDDDRLYFLKYVLMASIFFP